MRHDCSAEIIMCVLSCRQNTLRCSLFAVQLGYVTAAITQAALCAAAAWQPPPKPAKHPGKASPKASPLSKLPLDLGALAAQLVPDQARAPNLLRLHAQALLHAPISFALKRAMKKRSRIVLLSCWDSHF